jgi:hypothetical protein
MDYQDYPVVMKHPNYRPATHVQEPPDPKLPGAYKPASFGTPATLPDITVNTRDQEEEAASRGYVRAGVADPAAYLAAITGSPAPDREFHHYPKWKYHETEEPRTVNSAAEESALGPGWFDRPDLVRTPVISSESPMPWPEKPQAKAAPKKAAVKRRKSAPRSAETRAKISAAAKARHAAKVQQTEQGP